MDYIILYIGNIFIDSKYEKTEIKRWMLRMRM